MICFFFFSYSDKISQTTVLRIDNNSAPALFKTKEIGSNTNKEPISKTDETKHVTSTNKVYPQDLKPEFQQTKSLDFESKGL